MQSITLHILNSIPWSNLNRDGNGVPKVAVIGKTTRGRLSSQAIKRAIRLDYETATGVESIGSVRSRSLARVIAEEAVAQNTALEIEETKALAQKLIDTLVGKAPASSWLSDEEISVAATRIALGEIRMTDDKRPKIEFLETGGATGSLAIASFGRMFASESSFNTDAAIAVSPAVSVHPILIQNDYFITMDDAPAVGQLGSPADHMGSSQYLSGVFYRTVTIDVEQLRKNWAFKLKDGEAVTTELRRKLLTQLIRSIIFKLPDGKSTTTAPYIAPLVILAEEQSYRVAYDFETPVQAGVDGGFTEASVSTLAHQVEASRRFDSHNFGRAAVAGTADDLEQFKLPVTDVTGLVDTVLSWIQP
jgi:CRISPR system Cascade subunit CasC